MSVQSNIVWTNLYSDNQIAKYQIPAATALKPDEGVFRHLYLKWSALPQQTSAGAPLDLYNINSDVFVLDAPATISQGAFIFCRRIEVANGASITLNRATDALPFLLAVQEIVDAQTGQKIPLKITVSGKDGSSKDYALQVADDQNIALIQWEMDANEPVFPTSIDPAFLLEGEPLRMNLRTIFQVATLLSTEQQELCIKQLNWVAAIGSFNPITRPMSGQAFAFAVSVQDAITAALRDNAMLVPSLDPGLYADKAAAFMQLLQQRQSKWDALQAAADNQQNWLNAAKDALEVGQIQNTLDAQLLQKAVETTDQALASRRLVSKQLIALSISSYQKNELFKADVNRWGRDQQIKSAFAMIKTIFDIASSIPSVIAMGPEMAIAPAISMLGQAVQIGQAAMESVVDAVNTAPTANRPVTMSIETTSAVPTRFLVGNPPPNPNDKGKEEAEEGDGPLWIHSIGSEDSSVSVSNFVLVPKDKDKEEESSDDSSDDDDVIPKGDDSLWIHSTGSEELDIVRPPLSGNEMEEVPVEGAPPPAPDPDQLKKQEEDAKKRAAAAEKLAKSISDLGGKGVELIKTITNLANIGKKVDAFRKAGDRALGAAANTVGLTLSTYDLSGIDLLTGGEDHWETLSLQLNNLFKSIPPEIKAADAYKLELDKLIYMGRTYSHAQLALAKAKVKEAELRLRLQASMQSVGIFKNRVQKMGDKAFLDNGIKQLIFSKILEAKRSTYLAMEEYRRAFIYYTLSNQLDNVNLPRITADTDDFFQAVANISGNVLAKSSLQGQVSDFPAAEIVLNDPDLLQSFRDNAGALQWNCPTDTSVFNTFGRIRMSEMQVYLDGLEVKHQGPVEIKIVSNGVYLDKPTNQSSAVPRFVGTPMRFNFVYDTSKNNFISSSANISKRLVDYFFNPTPFSTWTIKAMAQDGSALDLSTVTGIRFLFTGLHTSL